MNNKKSNPSLKDLLDLLKRDIFLSMNCHALGTVESFDADTQSVSVSVNYTKTSSVADQQGNFTQQATNYPLLLDLPVIIMQGGPAALTFPIRVGDQCLVLFNDRDIDNWYADGTKTQPPNSQRAHSISDGIALIGLNPTTSSLANYSETHALLAWKNGGKVGVSSSKVLIGNALVPTLNDLLQELIIELLNVIANTASLATAAGQPAIAAALTAQGVLMTTTATKIGALLE